ncbi:M24 family metallopeptidase [Ilumatobacter nonamiensis]|uniref:M24 family metallopeptidase n=1 Tax=Ilumatobacter nonamiensis TaxID=467093 RepID=UPI00059160F7|nr:M24 family metallopeptidase [Ilumatobacter nonamiensis]
MPADIELPFERQEYRDRLHRTRLAMERRGVEVLFAADPSNMAWLTGYDGWSFYTYQGVIVTLDDDPVYWGRLMDAQGARRTVWMDDEHIVGYPDHFVQSTEEHPMEHLAHTLASRGLGNRRLGVELDNYYYSAAAHRALVETLIRIVPGASEQLSERDGISDATGLVNWQRKIKSDRELEYMGIAGEIVGRVYARLRDVLRPGMRKNDLVAEIMHATVTGTETHGGDYPAIVPLLPTGLDATASHLTWNDKPMEVGVGTFFELAGCYRRYHAPLCRSAFIGEPWPLMRSAEVALIEGLEAGIEQARAGNRACDVANALSEVLERAGIERTARCGYSTGLSYPPDWGERTISFRSTDETVLEPGMTFHFMPGLWMDTWGLEITESIVITADGPARTLADVPREIIVVDA